MRQDKPYDKSVFRSLMMVTQFGINMLVPIGIMCALGIYLDGKFHTGYITLICFVVGAVAGGQNVYRMAKRIFDEEAKEQHSPEAEAKLEELKAMMDEAADKEAKD